MANKCVTRRELLDRWRSIEQEEEENENGNDDTDHPSFTNRLNQRKEQWFADAFNFLILLPKETHIWCGSWDLMGPLMETFYNYYKDGREDSPLRLLWKRISKEMQQCIQCISKHHQAQEMYSMEYELSSVGPLLDVLRSLDEDRVTQHLRELNATIAREDYVAEFDNGSVVCVMYEVLMFPILLDDRSLFTEFEVFIEAVDNIHEVTLAAKQHFPGVYALFFFKRRVRSVGHRLASSIGKLRRVEDLEPLQPLLKKFIGFLETEVLPSPLEHSRPRAQLERMSVWLGLKSLLGFLEPPAFEEGILEHYPIFLDIVLNHISSDSHEFAHAVSCLRLLFEMLGCKLWLRSTLSPSVMRNTLLGQCFHTRSEKIHKDIFDLFQPFLQSLEALQDGEHEKQRRHFIYFLLHQVPVSSNFSVLTRKKACQIALLIIHRGYKMNPPCPPFECAHMWGPSLVSSLKDSSLHISLRQPAFDLIETIIVSDSAVLVTSMLNYCTTPSSERSMLIELNDDEVDDVLSFALDAEEKDTSSWIKFSAQSKITSGEFREWMCIPMLWIDVLVDVGPSMLPVSFSKAVFWARSRFSMIEPETSSDMELQVRDWLSASAKEISTSFDWRVPNGADDGGSEVSKNSMKVSTMYLSLIRTLNRLAAHFLVQLGKGEVWKQWTWEPRMGESLILLLVDPNDSVRQISKCILEQVSSTRGLASSLKFLCTSKCSLTAIFLGLVHALRLVRLDFVVSKFQMLQHFFFILRKLLQEGAFPESSCGHLNVTNFSSQGGFLVQPVLDSFPKNVNEHSSNVDLKLWEKFSVLLSEIAWPSIRKCLVEGKAFVDYSFCQMTCVRLLEILPSVFEKLCLPSLKLSGNCQTTGDYFLDFKWLDDLMEWGKSSLKVITVYWKRTVSALLNVLKGSCSDAYASRIEAIENLISSDGISVDELMDKVSLLSVSLSKEASSSSRKENSTSKSYSGRLSFEKKYSALDAQGMDSVMAYNRRDGNSVVVISDDETEEQISPKMVTLSDISHPALDVKTVIPVASKSELQTDPQKKKISGTSSKKDFLEAFTERHATQSPGIASQKHNFDTSIGKPAPAPLLTDPAKNISGIDTSKDLLDACGQRDATHDPSQKQSRGKSAPASLIKSKVVDGKIKETNSKSCVNDSSQDKIGFRKLSGLIISSDCMNQARNVMDSEPVDAVLKDLVQDTEDPLEFALKSARRQQSHMAKSSTFVTKRQVIQLQMPVENRSGNFRFETGIKRFKPPRLDDWYRLILEIDYFATVGLASATDKNQTVNKLKEVPVCFQSPEQYIKIFRPLVLEEFKAQLHSSFMEMSSLDEMYFGSVSVLSVERVDDFHLVRFVHDDNDSAASRSFSENDLVLLTKEPLHNSSNDVHVVGKLERRERDNKRRSSILLIRFYLLNGSLRLNQARRNLLERSKWHASRILSITPQLREFQALSSIKGIPGLPVILEPDNGSLSYNESRELDLGKLSLQLQQILKSSFNESQLKAISVSIGSSSVKKDFGLSLIQGPPGTGKTRTIVAIVSCLLASPVQRMSNGRNSLNESLNHGNNSRINLGPRISQSAAIARAWQDAALAKNLNEDVNRISKSSGNFSRGRVLICAQSNAAVDELVSRISNEGLCSNDGKRYKPYLVRVGNAKTVHPNSLPFFIDTLVDHRLAEEKTHLSDANNKLSVESSMALRSNLEKLADRIRFYEAKRANLRDENVNIQNALEDETYKDDDGKQMSDADIEVKLKKLYEQKKQIYKDLSIAQSQEKKNNEEIKAHRHKLRKSILREADIVVTTLSGSGGDLFGVCSESMSSYKFANPSEHTLFDAVVIDEAAQALEPATLIPLQLLKSNGTKCIMVGDPKQLPATVLSNIASKFQYQCSMFERLQRAGHPVIMLTEQYRMHPEICRFPSLHFYDGKLLNGKLISSKAAPFHETEGLGPYVFYDIIDGQEVRGNNSGALSLCNKHEVDAAVEVLRFFKKSYPCEFLGGRIGIITPYKSQLSLLRSRFSSAFGSSVTADMEFNTVDGFQGREVDILILSTVRAADPLSATPGISSSSIGFVADVRRMNVALTRAKLSLWILGNARTLQTNQNWAALVKDARQRNLILSGKMPYKSLFKTYSGKNPATDNCDNNSGKPRLAEMVNDISQHSKRSGSNAKEANVKKTKHNHYKSQSNRRIDGGEHCSSTTREDIRSNKRDRDRHDSLVKKDAPSVVANVETRESKDVQFAISRKHETNCESKGKESREKKHGFGDKRKLINQNSSILDHPEQEMDHSHKVLQFQMSGGIKSSQGDRSQRNPKALAPSTEGSLKMRDANDDCTALNQVSTQKDLIAKRKQQREAVNAILPSAFIPSKRSGNSSKSLPAKRPLSATSTDGRTKPPKSGKVLPTSP